jgi:putative spermidine/putrescine transport system substrate-binding protein
VDVLDVGQFPGKRGFLNTPAYSPEEVMLGTGRSIDSVYPIDIDLYLNTLSKVRKSAVFLDTNPLTNQVTQGDIATGDLNQTRLNSAIDAGAPIEYNWMQTIVDVNRWGIPKGAPNLENAYKLINFSLRPDIQKSIPKAFGTYSPVVTGAYKGMTLAEQKNLAGSPPNRDQSAFLQTDWYAQHGNELSQRFAQWLTS